ncbi:MAG: replication initiation protein RepC [Rhodobacteraceae bacterium]|nr:replication initiation protein RepC [Paracoccaceae bacterium]
MQQISLTPFGRQPVTAAQLESRRLAEKPPALPRADKWSLFAELRTARSRFGVTDRDLTVLNALLSFLPSRDLVEDAGLVVFPSNVALSERAHGMAESTLRRHLAALVAAGLIWRQDSPNGKRYTRRGAGGQLEAAFGFDLRPLLLRADEIARAGAEVAEAVAALARQREVLVLRLRDAAKLLAHGREEGLPGDWDGVEARLLPVRATLRRKMDAGTLAQGIVAVGAALRILMAMLELPQDKSDGSAAQNERHHHNSNPESFESEPCRETAKAAAVGDPDKRNAAADPEDPPLPFALVLKACPDVVPYARHGLAGWRDLVATAAEVRGMMGISPTAWDEAQRYMGRVNAAIAVSAILQRYDRIANPGGYLRALSDKAANGAFSPGPMIMALLRAS